MGSYDLFLNSKEFKHDSFDILDTTSWNLDDDGFLESIRYGDKLLAEDELVSVNSLQADIEPETDSSAEVVEFDSSDILTYTVGEEVLSIDSVSSSGSCSGSENMDDPHNYSVVELVGILPGDVKTFQIVQQVPHRDEVKILNVHKLGVQGKKSATAQLSQHHKQAFQELKLTDEERRLLTKEGITLPPHYPLTKSEERELKRIRRKIRNKISAQDSRKRKKEFLDTLQQRVQEVEEENSLLSKKVRTLEVVNSRLSAQVKKLQGALATFARNATNQGTSTIPNPNTSGSNKVQAATTLLVLILSLALVVLPTMQKTSKASFPNNGLGTFDDSNTSIVGKSRTMVNISPNEWETMELHSEPLAKIPRFSFPSHISVIGKESEVGISAGFKNGNDRKRTKSFQNYGRIDDLD